MNGLITIGYVFAIILCLLSIAGTVLSYYVAKRRGSMLDLSLPAASVLSLATIAVCALVDIMVLGYAYTLAFLIAAVLLFAYRDFVRAYVKLWAVPFFYFSLVLFFPLAFPLLGLGIWNEYHVHDNIYKHARKKADHPETSLWAKREREKEDAKRK